MLQLYDVEGTTNDVVQNAEEELLVAVGQVAVEQTHQIPGRTLEQPCKRSVGTNQVTGQGHRRHPDRGLVEDLTEPFEVLVENSLVT